MVTYESLLEYIERKKKELVSAAGSERDEIYMKIGRLFMEWHAGNAQVPFRVVPAEGDCLDEHPI